MQPEHPQIARKRLHRRMALLKIVLSPIFWVFYVINMITRLLGLESKWTFFIFKHALKDAQARMRRGFEGYKPTKNDVFICSYPKSGTNWGMQIAYQIAHKGKGEYEHVHDVVAWPDATKDGIAVPLQHPMALQSPTGMRIIKTHAASHEVPYSPDAKYVCIVRDPKDAIVSAYHFFKDVEMGYLIPSIPAWLDLALVEGGVNWAVFAKGYWEWRQRPNVLFITFEEMKANLEESVQKIANLMGISLTPEEFEHICYLSSYKYMKTIDHKFYPGRIAPLASPNGSMIRSGKKGESEQMLTPEQRHRIDAFHEEWLRQNGSDFPYKELYGKK